MVYDVKDRVLPETKMQISWMCATRFGNGDRHALDNIGSEKSGPLIRAVARSCAPGRAAREGPPFFYLFCVISTETRTTPAAASWTMLMVSPRKRKPQVTATTGMRLMWAEAVPAGMRVMAQL